MELGFNATLVADGDPLDDCQRGPNGTLRVVALRAWSSEEPADRITDELLHGSAEPRELRPNAIEVGREHTVDGFWIEILRLPG